MFGGGASDTSSLSGGGLHPPPACWDNPEEYDPRQPCARLVHAVYCNYAANFPPDILDLLRRQFACGGTETAYRACMDRIRESDAYMFDAARQNEELSYLLTHFRDHYRNAMMKVCRHDR